MSLSSIPPELQQQLELRLRNEFGPKVIAEARHQSADLLAAAKSAIEQKTIEAYQQFTGRVAEDLKGVEKRAQDLSAHIFDNAREHMRRGLEDFHQQLLEGGNSLKRLSEQLLEFLQQSLNDEHDARRGDLEKLRVRVESESSHLREQMDSLDSRIAKAQCGDASLRVRPGPTPEPDVQRDLWEMCAGNSQSRRMRCSRN